MAVKRAPHRAGHLALASQYKQQGKIIMGGALADLSGASVIFRSKEDKASDILNHKVFYEAMIRMIDNYEYIFDEELDILD